MESADYIVVGSGLTGATIARRLHDVGREVLILDRRNHLGGNVHDHRHESGVIIHTYGPHYFRTSSEKIWDFANRFSDFYDYQPCLLTLVDGEKVPWPLWKSWISSKLGNSWQPEFKGVPANFEEAALSLMPRFIYDRFVKEYNEKQWGVPAKSLDAELCTRFDVRELDEPKLKPDAKYQGIPTKGYAGWMASMVDGIQSILRVDYLRQKGEFLAKKKLIFTGPIDEYFDFSLGKLKYRGQRRENIYHPDKEFVQEVGQINAPQHKDGPWVRWLEWKHMQPKRDQAAIRGTVVTTETPYTPANPHEYEYPFPDKVNANLYKAYRTMAESQFGVLICGRLGEYRYYDMDQAIGRALGIAERLVKEN